MHLFSYGSLLVLAAGTWSAGPALGYSECKCASYLEPNLITALVTISFKDQKTHVGLRVQISTPLITQFPAALSVPYLPDPFAILINKTITRNNANLFCRSGWVPAFTPTTRLVSLSPSGQGVHARPFSRTGPASTVTQMEAKKVSRHAH